MANELITVPQLETFGNRIKQNMDDIVLGDIASVSGFSNPNMLDNWYFLDAVNQSENTVCTEEFSWCCIDRWRSLNNATGYYKYDKGLGLANATTDSPEYLHGIGQDVKVDYLPPGKYTLSIWSSNGVGKCKINIYNSGTTVGPFDFDYRDDTFVYHTFTVDTFLTNVTMRVWVSFKDAGNSTNNYIKAVKLERGSKQTLMVKDSSGNWFLNDIPNKDLELFKCKKYLCVISSQTRNVYFGRAIYIDTDHTCCFVNVPYITKAQYLTKIVGGPSAFCIFEPNKLNLTSGGSIYNISSIKYTGSGNTALLDIRTTNSDLKSDGVYLLRSYNSSARMIFGQIT